MESISRLQLNRQLVHRLTESLIDHDIVVDDIRREIDAAVARLNVAVGQRDAIAQQLAELVERMAA
jgi:hypothetical protein